MELIIVVLLHRIISFITVIFNKESNVAGRIALAIKPDILSSIELPKLVIGITGSNGKTSTAEMAKKVFSKVGLNVGYSSGASSLEDVVTLVLKDTALNGKYQKDVILLDVDENKAKDIFTKIILTHCVITNISRNQMSKDGNPDFVLKQIKKSISPKTVLILNTDDPNALSLDNSEIESHYYGINDNFYATKDNDYIYNDLYYCPRCKSKLVYEYHQFGQIGKYRCSKCKFARKKPEVYISDVDIDNGNLVINNKYEIKLGFNSISNAYNVIAAYALCYFIGIKEDTIAYCLNDYFDSNGSIKNFKLGLNRGISLVSKHENPVSYNQNLEHILRFEKDCTVLLILDEINKNYLSINTSWLWDISFDILNCDHIKEIVLTGRFVDDLKERLEYAEIDMSKVYVNKSIDEAIKHIKNGNRFIYCLASSSDEAKLIKKVNAIW